MYDSDVNYELDLSTFGGGSPKGLQTPKFWASNGGVTLRRNAGCMQPAYDRIAIVCRLHHALVHVTRTIGKDGLK